MIRRSAFPHFYFFFTVILICLISCTGELITETDIIILEDTFPPVIRMETPENNGYYSSHVLVKGQVTDFAGEGNIPGKIDKLAYRVIGTVRGGTIRFDDHGFFSFTFYSGDFEGEKTLVISCSDWNGNKTEEYITLNKGSFQSLEFTPGNKKILLNWDSSPLISSYTIYYTENGTVPGPSNSIPITGVLPPYTLDGLTNGLLYSLVIMGDTGKEVNDWSELIQTIPLSPFTLAPRVKGEYKEIYINWDSIPGAESYRILKSTSKSNQFTTLPGLYTTTSFIDNDVIPGQPYFYKIKPAMENSIESEPVYGESFVYPPFASLIGSYNTNDFAYSVVVQGSYAYVADRNNGLVIIDITNPATPKQVGQCPTSGYAYDVAITQTHAYIAADAAGLCIVDITNPAAPYECAVFSVDEEDGDVEYASAVAVGGASAYVTVKNFGLQIVDISDPHHPQLQGSYLLAESPLGIVIDETYAYIAGGESGLIIINISDPTQPARAGSFDTLHMAYDIAVADSYAYVADDESGIRILDISDFEGITPVGFYDAPGPGGARSIILSDIYAYVANDSGGVIIINIENREQPELIETYDSLAYAKGIFVKDQFAYVAAYDQGLLILSAAEPSGLLNEYTIDASSYVMDIAIEGNYAYVAASNQSNQGLLLVYSINQGSIPGLVDSYTSFSGQFRHVTICGNFAFIGGYNMGLEIVEISQPTACEYVGFCNFIDSTTNTTVDETIDAELRGDYIYVSYRQVSGESGVVIYDISDPWNPEFVTSYDTNDSAKDIALAGDYMYVADEDEGIYIIDTTRQIAASPYTTTGRVTGITINNSIICIADGSAGIQLADISQPRVPSFLGGYNTPGFAFRAEMRGRYIFVADKDNGLVVLDYSQPDNLIKAGGYNENISGEGTQYVRVRGSFVYITEDTNIHVIDLWPYDDL